MKRFVIAALATAALMVPASVMAQDESPEASMAPDASMGTEASMGPIGMDTFDVCLSISGPVIEMTPEALTQGISDGTFVIEGMSSDCEAAPMDDATASEEPMDEATASEEPMDDMASAEPAESDG